MTNEERIKSMGTEELARFISDCRAMCTHCVYNNDPYCQATAGDYCENGIFKWLKSEVDHDQL